MSETARQFPQSLEAERALLGGLLLDNAQIASMGEILDADDFYSAGHAGVFRFMMERSTRNEPVDVLSLADHMISTNKVEEFGGLAYISSLPEQVPTTENLVSYASIVREKAIRRRLLRTIGEIGEKVYEGEDQLPELLDFAERSVFEVAQQRSTKQWHQLGQIIDVEWQRLEELTERSGDVTGLTTGFIDLDKMLAGLQKSDLIVLAARPAMGKTAFALNIAQNVATLTGAGVGIFSLEMGRGQLATRMLCSQARVDAGRVRTGRLQEEHWQKLTDASEALYHAPLWIDDSPGLTITQLRSKARRLASETNNLGLIVIDYLQLMSTGDAASREQGISAISRGLKGLAKELNIPVIALSQLNRGVEQRNPKIPMISDLRESGAIEQDADIIMFIYREEYYKEDSGRVGEADIIIAKQRNGPTGDVVLAWTGRFTRFDNFARESDLAGGYG